MLKWIENLKYRIYMFWCLREKANCDQCSGVFRRRDLTPTSGDWWLCDSCFSSLMADMAKDAKNHGV